LGSPSGGKKKDKKTAGRLVHGPLWGRQKSSGPMYRVTEFWDGDRKCRRKNQVTRYTKSPGMGTEHAKTVQKNVPG